MHNYNCIDTDSHSHTNKHCYTHRCTHTWIHDSPHNAHTTPQTCTHGSTHTCTHRIIHTCTHSSIHSWVVASVNQQLRNENNSLKHQVAEPTTRRNDLTSQLDNVSLQLVAQFTTAPTAPRLLDHHTTLRRRWHEQTNDKIGASHSRASPTHEHGCSIIGGTRSHYRHMCYT